MHEPQDAPRTIARRRRWPQRLGVAVLVLIALIVLARWAFAPRQSVVRLDHEIALRAVAQAALIYHQNHGAAPTFDDLLSTSLIDPHSLRAFSRAEQRPGAGEPGVDLWLVQSRPSRAVRKGEAWGGPGEKLDKDLPASRVLLLKDWTILRMDEPAYQQSLAPRLNLAPIE